MQPGQVSKACSFLIYYRDGSGELVLVENHFQNVQLESLPRASHFLLLMIAFLWTLATLQNCVVKLILKTCIKESWWTNPSKAGLQVMKKDENSASFNVFHFM